MTEPKYIAYRVDQKRLKEFYDIEDAAKFFNCKKNSLLFRARGYDQSHMTGLNINEKWMFFDTDLPHKQMSDMLKFHKSSNYIYYDRKKDNGKMRKCLVQRIVDNA